MRALPRVPAGRESLCEDLLYLLGGFAERLLVPERVVRTNVHRLPDGLELSLAPLAEPLACAVHALDACEPARAWRSSAPARSG